MQIQLEGEDGAAKKVVHNKHKGGGGGDKGSVITG